MSKGFARNGWPRGSEAILAADLVASATPHTKGSWVQIDASLARNICGLTIAPDASIGQTTVDTSMLLDIGIGAAASEAVVVSNLPVGFLGAGVQTFLPIHIPAGTRIAARIQGAVVSDTYAPVVILHFADRPGMWSGYALAETIGVDTATSGPTTGDLTDNAWDEAIASTANAYRALTCHITGPAGSTTLQVGIQTVDVGVGGAGSEQLLGSYAVRTASTEIVTHITGSPFIEVAVPAGSRLAIRKNTTNDLSAALIGWR